MKIFISILFIGCFQFCFSQTTNLVQSDQQYIKIVIDKDIDDDTQQQITDYFYQKEGVITSRMDNSTRMYLCIYKTNSPLTEASFLNWFANNNYIVKCYYQAPYLNNRMIELTKFNCQ